MPLGRVHEAGSLHNRLSCLPSMENSRSTITLRDRRTVLQQTGARLASARSRYNIRTLKFWPDIGKRSRSDVLRACPQLQVFHGTGRGVTAHSFCSSDAATRACDFHPFLSRPAFPDFYATTRSPKIEQSSARATFPTAWKHSAVAFAVLKPFLLHDGNSASIFPRSF